MSSELRIAELLCTRLCHDLTGPIGAVNNGAEFLAEEGLDLQNQAMQLVISSAGEAISRLQFYRLAYGKVNDSGEADLEDKKERIAEFFKGSKLTLDWPDNNTNASGVSISNKMARLLLNMVIIASGTLLKGGSVAIRLTETDSAKEIRVSARGSMVKADASIANILLADTPKEELNPKTVQLYLARKLAEEINATLTTVTTQETFEITAHQPR